MNLIRLARHQHPNPPHHELRQKRVLDREPPHRARVNLAADRRGSVQPLGYGLRKLSRERPHYSQVHHPDYTLPRSFVLNGRKPLVKDR